MGQLGNSGPGWFPSTAVSTSGRVGPKLEDLPRLSLSQRKAAFNAAVPEVLILEPPIHEPGVWKASWTTMGFIPQRYEHEDGHAFFDHLEELFDL
jgi:hypothetical protein